MGPLLQNSAGYSVAALLVLMLCKSLAYGLSMSAFRGGPVFPAMFLRTEPPHQDGDCRPASARWWVCGRAIDPGVGGALEVGRWRRKRSDI
jgi:hypothetical protein